MQLGLHTALNPQKKRKGRYRRWRRGEEEIGEEKEEQKPRKESGDLGGSGGGESDKETAAIRVIWQVGFVCILPVGAKALSVPPGRGEARGSVPRSSAISRGACHDNWRRAKVIVLITVITSSAHYWSRAGCEEKRGLLTRGEMQMVKEEESGEDEVGGEG